MESLLCNEVWLMSPNVAPDVQENDGCNNAKGNVSTCFFSTKQDCEEAFAIFLDKEASYMPEPGYLTLVKTNDLIHDARFKAVNWLIKSQRRMNFSLGTVFIAVNYLDRFISLTDQCQGWKHWSFDLLSIACLSVASKFNETTTTPLHDFQVEGLDHSFAPSLIQRMELTLLKRLGWRMDSTTPFSYIDFLIQSIDDALNKSHIQDLTKRVTELLLTALLDPKFLEFQPCVIAMSAVRCAFEDLFPSTDNASLVNLETIIRQDQKDDLIKCERIVGKLLVQDHDMLACGSSWRGPSSPVTVLKTECFNFYDCPIDLSLLRMPGVDMDLRSRRKRKRKELECGM
ncbi:UNVERIFIED_CONTAM: Cyclin-D2-2 [Sesamum latifolium]|uniref:Cyclin-D2-2 n=1 Tax=Sesamum latifolium TaxID=2727402 RepID=A0AAW2XDN6_9LAMI